MYKLLFVDDESIYRLAVRNIIDWEQRGFTITGTASNGAEALDFLKRERVDGVITDLEMPVMDGVTLIKKLRGRGFAGPILALSNYSDYVRVRGALTAGAFDYLVKIDLTAAQLIPVLEKMTHLCRLLESRTGEQGGGEGGISTQQRVELLQSYILTPSSDALPGNLLHIIPRAQFPLVVCTLKMIRSLPRNAELETFLETAVREAFKEVHTLYIFPPGSGDLLFLIPEISLRSAKISLRARLEILSRQLNAFLSARVLLTFVPGVETVRAIRDAYRRCTGSYHRRFYCGAEAILDLSAVPVPAAFPPIREDFLTTALSVLRRADCGAFPQAVREFLEACRQNSFPPELVKETMTLLLQCCSDLKILALGGNRLRETVSAIRACSDSGQLETAVTSAFSSHTVHQAAASPCHPEILRILLFVNQNYGGKLTLEELAARAGLTREYLSRLFLKETGVNLFQYIMDIRMRKAADMLSGCPPVLVKEVALAVGFDNQYSFSKKFKEYYGVSPNAYKENAAFPPAPPSREAT